MLFLPYVVPRTYDGYTVKANSSLIQNVDFGVDISQGIS